MSSESGEKRPAAKTYLQGGTKPPELEQLPCPRCQSSNTKFCYYNNYNLSQPRYFCKSCRRYWTRGGTLRNVPVGGGTRKSSALKRSRSAAATAASSSSSSTLTYDPIPADPVSEVPGSKPEMGHEMSNLNLNQAVSGGFSSLLATQQAPVFGSFGGFGLGLGSGIRGMGFGLSPWDWPMEEAGGGNGGGGEGGCSGGGMVVSGGGAPGCSTWQVGGVEGGLGDGDCFGWPDLAISTPGNGVN